MSQKLGVIIMMNNYFHDVATALLLASGIAVWVMFSKYDNNAPEVREYFMKIYRGITRLAQFSLVWILLGGIPRTIFYKDFEWANAVGKNQVPALIVKHVIAFTIVGAGVYVWLKLSKRIKDIRESMSP
jgi:hypothetical protein